MRDKKDFIKLCTWMCLLLATPVCSAALFGSDESSTSSGQDMTLKEKVRARLYSGGKDEEPLKVQVQVLAPSRKHSNSIENSTEPNSED